MPLKPPRGWATLQEKARRANNPQELAGVIEEMNKMLAEFEQADGDHAGKPQPTGKKGRGRRTTSKKKQS